MMFFISTSWVIRTGLPQLWLIGGKIEGIIYVLTGGQSGGDRFK